MAKQKKKSNRLMYWGIGTLIALILFVIIGKSAGWIGKTKELEVELAKAKKVSITEKVSASGTSWISLLWRNRNGSIVSSWKGCGVGN